MRKKGYIIERGSNEAIITNLTKRSEKQEIHAEQLGIKTYYDNNYIFTNNEENK